jgi:hypothetical protein
MPHVRLTDRPAIQGGTVVAPKIETDIAPDTLRFHCPKTGREVDSGIDTQRSAHLISIRVRCPICKDLHDWQVTDESSGTVISIESHSNGARFIKRESAPQDFQGPHAEITELREQLLDELNHRLKNNLQILYGCLQIAPQNEQRGSSRGPIRHEPANWGDGGGATGLLFRPQLNRRQRTKFCRSCLCQCQSLLQQRGVDRLRSDRRISAERDGGTTGASFK